MAFYVEDYADSDGMFAISMRVHAVIEGEIEHRPDAGQAGGGGRDWLRIDAPPEVASRHEGLFTDAYGGFVEVGGPARVITDAEHRALLAGRSWRSQVKVRQSPVS